MATAPRVLWKGAISFGLVHIPVSLHTATRQQRHRLRLARQALDGPGRLQAHQQEDGQGNRQASNIVKGIEYEDGQYVVLTEDEIKAAYPKSTQIDRHRSLRSDHRDPFVYLERPYYLAPTGKGAKVYALLRETCCAAGAPGWRAS